MSQSLSSKKTTFFQILKQQNFIAWLFLAPALILLTIFLFLPIISLIYLSFTDGNLVSNKWIGLANYQRLLIDSDFKQIIFNTLYFAIATIIPSIIIPLFLSILLNQKIILRGFFRTAYFIPSITSLVAMGLGFRWLFQNNGPINELLLSLNINPIPWLNSTFWAMPVIIIFSTWRQIGFNLVVFLAGLQAIPQNRYEAAELDGANFWAKLWYITLPSLKPTLIFATITTAIFTFRSFEQVYIITNGGPSNSTNLLSYYIYEQAFRQFNFGYAAATTSILLIFAIILVAIQLIILKD
ncbi:MAG: sugar ABC transporter permease [Cyanobacteria bacterium]|nr:sugar ABC transporter permease [Cyanobacteria bacterium CG_2015-22_32_23]NCQ04695.1 sugar ABC transporter permease [Cyanobacteria bacterium CG_2015-09_32_10]NCQ42723.1 sugar ABC transporter permease [Cyanobacteria bacterium CG_2015-04_32_10]NCS83349.1 sugar ABC transporter permease [Cyanobacteria bacterium CG_2015-02_32_10]